VLRDLLAVEKQEELVPAPRHASIHRRLVGQLRDISVLLVLQARVDHIRVGEEPILELWGIRHQRFEMRWKLLFAPRPSYCKLDFYPVIVRGDAQNDTAVADYTATLSPMMA
jgi:hypothetical protein